MTREESKAPQTATAPARSMSRDEMLSLFDRRQEAMDNLDAAALVEDYADDCVVDSPTAGVHSGRTAILAAFRAVFDGFPDMKLRSERLLIDGDRVAHLVEIEGTDIGGFLGVPPTGKSFRVPAIFLYEFKDRLIVRERRIYDYTGVLIQIGLLKAKPI